MGAGGAGVAAYGLRITVLHVTKHGWCVAASFTWRCWQAGAYLTSHTESLACVRSPGQRVGLLRAVAVCNNVCGHY